MERAIQASPYPKQIVNYCTILLILGTYPRMTDMDAPLSTIYQCSIAICKVMEEVRRFHISCQVNNKLNTKYGPSTSLIHNLLTHRSCFFVIEI